MSRLGVVTGGARGIGLAAVEALLGQDVCDEVVVFDREPADIPGVKVVQCDVCDAASVERAVDTLGDAPTVLVNNAGGQPTRPGDPPLDAGQGPWVDIEIWRQTVDLNLNSAFIVTRALAPKMRRGAAICNVSSIGGLVASTGLMAYGASKAALIHWTRSLSIALAGEGIRVNAVAPGFVYTRLWDQHSSRQVFDQMVAAAVPMGTGQDTSDIANTIAFLCSSRASQVTGQTIAVDGGVSVGPRQG